MKKQVKVLLFCMLVILMVATMAFAVAATPESPTGATTYDAEAHYYKVTISEVDYYYADLNLAIADVPSGGTISVLANVPTQSAVTLTRADVAYTVESNGTEPFTISFVKGESANMMTVSGTTSVTLKNVKVAAASTEDAWTRVIQVLDNVTLTLDGFTSEVKATYTVNVQGKNATLNVQDSRLYNEGGYALMVGLGLGSGKYETSPGNTVNIKSGTLASLKSALYVNYGAANTTLTIGDSTDAAKKPVLTNDVTGATSYAAVVEIRDDLVFNIYNAEMSTVAACTTPLLRFFASNAKLTIHDGTYTGNRWVSADGEATNTASNTMKGDDVDVVIKGGAFTSNATATATDMYVLHMGATNASMKIEGNVVVNAGAYTKAIFCFNNGKTGIDLQVTSGSFIGGDVWMFANAAGNYTFGGTVSFTDPDGTISEATGLKGWLGAFVLNNENAILNVTGGSFEFNPKVTAISMFYACKAKVNVSGGNLTATKMFAMHGSGADLANVTVSGGTINAVRVFSESATWNFEITGGTFKCTDVFFAGAGVDGTHTVTGATIELSGGALYPTTANTGLDLSATTITVTGAVRVELNTAGEYVVRTKQDVLALITAELGETAAASLPTDVWHGLVLNNSGIRMEVLGEALAEHADNEIFSAKQGVLLAPRGVDVYVAGTHFYKLEVNGKFFYYKTLAAAFEDLNNGGTIYLADNVDAGEWNFNHDMTYTIDGCGFTMTFKPSIANATYNYTATFLVSKGNITFKNVSLAVQNNSAVSAIVYLQNSANDRTKQTVIFEDVVIDVKSTYGVWVYKETTLVIRGEGTRIAGGSTNLIRMQNGAKASVVTIEGGTFTGTSTQMVYMDGPGACVTIKGGDFSAMKAGILVNATAKATDMRLTIYGGSFTATNTKAFNLLGSGTVARFMGGEVFAAGNGVYSESTGSYKIIFTNKDEEGNLIGDGKGMTFHSYDGAVLNLGGKPSLVIEAGTFICGEEDGDGSTYNQELIKLVVRGDEATNALQKFDISGGTFIKEGPAYASNIAYGVVISVRIPVKEGVALNISGGTFKTDYNYKTSIFGIIYDCEIKISEDTGKVAFESYQPFFIGYDQADAAQVELNKSLKVKISISGGQFDHIAGFVTLADNVKFPSVNISGGEINGTNLFTLHAENSIHISGGKFTAWGAGNYAFNLTVPTTAENFSITGGTFKVWDRAWVISAVSPFEIGENASFIVSDVAGFTIGKAGEGTISSSASYKSLFEAQYPNATYTAGTSLPKLQIFHDDFVLTIAGGSYAARAGETLFYLNGGSIVVTGGTLSASGGGVIFDVQKATSISVTGGKLSANGKNSYIFKFAYDIPAENFSATGGEFEIKNQAHAPIVPGAVFTAAIKIYDLFEIEINQPNLNPEYDAVNNPGVPQYIPYVLDKPTDIANFAEASLKNYFPNVSVTITKFLPIIMNCADAKLVINAGAYTIDEGVLFTIKAGTVEIVGGSFSVTKGGRIFDVEGGELLINNGSFTATAFDTENKSILINVYGADAKVTIKDGSFTAARILYVTEKVDVTISGGTFTSNAKLVSGAFMIELASLTKTSKIKIEGGSFTGNEKTAAILAVTAATASALTPSGMDISGGVFDGGCAWIYAIADVRFTINANADPLKNPVFVDTKSVVGGEFGSPAHVWFAEGAPQLNINAGSFTTSTALPMVYLGGGKSTVKGGTLTGGALFLLTQNTNKALNVSGDATLVASGGGAYIFQLGEDVSNSAVNITKGYFTVQDGAFVDFKQASLFAKATRLTIKSIAGWELNEAGTHTITSSGHFKAMAEAFAKTKFTGKNCEVMLDDSWMPMIVNNKDAVLIFTDGAYDVHSDYFLTLNAGKVEVLGGTFELRKGSFILMNGTGEITIGSATSAPSIKVTTGYNVIRANGVKNSTITINDGSFAKVAVNRKGEFATQVIDTANLSGALFTFQNDCTGTTMIINDGTFTAARIAQCQDAGSNILINGGHFKSTFRENNYIGGVAPASDLAILFRLNAGSKLEVNGGLFDGGLGNSIFALCDSDTSELHIKGGEFLGAIYWIFSDRVSNITIENTLLPNGTEIVPTFSDPYSSIKYGIYLNEQAVNLSIKGGHFSTVVGHIIYFSAPAIVEVSGGTFWIDPTEDNPGVVLYPADAAATLTVNGGVFFAARILHLSVAMTVTVNGGTFNTNSIKADGANYAHFFRVCKNGAKLIINGGELIGNANIYSLVTMNEVGGTVEINGGSLEGGQNWIVINANNCTLIIDNPSGDPEKAPKFKDMSKGSSSYGIYTAWTIPNTLVHIKAGVFDISAECEGKIMRTGGGAKIIIEEGVTMSSAGQIFYCYDSFQANILIKGGTFKVIANGIFCYYRFSKSSEANYYGQLVIEGGTFVAEEAAALFQFGAVDERAKLIVKGGTFTSESGRMIYMFGTKVNGEFIIEGGYWESTGSRMFYIEQCIKPLMIKDGTFVFANKGNSLKNLENAMIYLAARNLQSEVVIEGGIFIDERRASQQTLLKQNAKAVVTIKGDVQFFVKEKKAFFYYDADNPMNRNIASSLQTVQKFLPEGCAHDGSGKYYVYSHYDGGEYAPVLVGVPTLRANLGNMGIRFTSVVSATAAAELAKLGTVSYGTLIFKTSSLPAYESGANIMALLEQKGAKYENVVAQNGLATDANGNITINASLVNIKSANVGECFTGVAYAKVVASDGTETYYFATHIDAAASATLQQVAYNALNDVAQFPSTSDDGRVFCFNSVYVDSYMSRYTFRQQEEMRSLLPKEQQVPEKE